MRPTRYADEYRRQVVTSVLLDGVPIADAAHRYEVSQSTVRRWVDEVRRRDTPQVSSRRRRPRG